MAAPKASNPMAKKKRPKFRTYRPALTAQEGGRIDAGAGAREVLRPVGRARRAAVPASAAAAVEAEVAVEAGEDAEDEEDVLTSRAASTSRLTLWLWRWVWRWLGSNSRLVRRLSGRRGEGLSISSPAAAASVLSFSRSSSSSAGRVRAVESSSSSCWGGASASRGGPCSECSAMGDAVGCS